MKKGWSFLVCLLLFCGCSVRDDLSGDGAYSYLTSDFVELRIREPLQAVSAVNDKDELLHFIQPLECRWATKGDTVYRALLYYNIIPEKVSVSPQSAVPVSVLHPQPSYTVVTMKTDPVVFRSAWVSSHLRYLNIGIGLKTGQDSSLPETTKHVIGIVKHPESVDESGRRVHHWVLYHAQNEIPAYYTQDIYASVPLLDVDKNDVIELTIHTFQGTVVKRFTF